MAVRLARPTSTTIRDRLRKEIGQAQEPAARRPGPDDDEPVEAAARPPDRARTLLGGRFPDGVLQRHRTARYVWIAALPPGGIFGERAGESLHHAAEQAGARHTTRARFHPADAAEVLGPVATLIANRAGGRARHPVGHACICAVVVALSILLFFRRWRAVPLIGIPAVMGTVMAFAVAQLAFGYVNSSTAFLGSIILGNGINYAIILMARYQEQRAAGDDARARRWSGRVAGVAGRHRGGGAVRLGRLRLADADQLPRLLPVRGDGGGRRAVLLDGHLHGAAGADRRAATGARPGSAARQAPLSLAPLAGC